MTIRTRGKRSKSMIKPTTVHQSEKSTEPNSIKRIAKRHIKLGMEKMQAIPGQERWSLKINLQTELETGERSRFFLILLSDIYITYRPYQSREIKKVRVKDFISNWWCGQLLLDIPKKQFIEQVVRRAGLKITGSKPIDLNHVTLEFKNLVG